MNNAKKYSTGTELLFPGNKFAFIEKSLENGIKIIKTTDSFFNIDYLEKFGNLPLPPYLKKNPGKLDKKRYQTTFSIHHGSSAAPTAGLHFDKKIFKSLDKKNIQYAYVTLHVSLGTFQPIYTENIEEHKIHTEEYFIDKVQAYNINSAIKNNKKIIPVGTTSLRTLETAFINNKIKDGKGESSLYIYPSYKFKVANGLITNFHTPRSSLAVLVSAMIGVEKLLEIYQYAVKKEYRFFSYGDAMLIV
jgi:S-adenosylmethionine:tRNA ribosyltransferase-isomerase